VQRNNDFRSSDNLSLTVSSMVHILIYVSSRSTNYRLV